MQKILDLIMIMILVALKLIFTGIFLAIGFGVGTLLFNKGRRKIEVKRSVMPVKKEKGAKLRF